MLTKDIFNAGKELAKGIVSNLNYCVTPYHVVDLAKKKLSEIGFKEIREVDIWSVKPGDKLYFTRNLSSLVAFSIGEKYDPATACMKIVVSHTDSPAIKFAPIAKLESNGCLQAAVQLYGGGLWHTWFDRDLSLAGKVIVKQDGKLTTKLFHYKDPLLKIPSLAIHFTRMYEKFEFNLEKHLRPIIATTIIDQLMHTPVNLEGGLGNKHHNAIVTLIAEEIKVKPEDIVDFDLLFVDTQPSQLFGINKEFISSGRLDNQLSAQCELEAWCKLHIADYLKTDGDINMMVLFDHEEVGSGSVQGAASNFLCEVTKRISEILCRELNAKNINEQYQTLLRRSFMISADTAHVVHPNWPEIHQELHKPHFHKGIVVKMHVSQNYATDPVSGSILKEVCKLSNVPLQDFVVKCDSLCGRTLGPLCAQQMGIKTVDIGMGQLSMHSIRETCATTDVLYYTNLFKGFFENYKKVSKDLLEN
jgi:aspartyl aminopeptidase